MEDFAINPDTGEAVIWSGGQWQPAPIADNPTTGDRLAFNGKGWVPLPKMPERADSIGGAIKSIWNNPAPGAISRGPFDPSLIGTVKSIAEGVRAPGRIMSGEYSVTPEVPGQWSEADEFRAQHARQTMQGNAGALAGTILGGALPRVALGGGRGELGIGGGRPGASTPLTRPEPPPPAMPGQVVEAAERVGVDLPRFLVDPSRTTQGLAAGLSNIPGAGDKIAKATQGTTQALGGATSAVAEGFGSGSPVVAGSQAKEAITGWITGDSKKVAARVYDAVDSAIDPAVKTELNATRTAAQEIMARRAESKIPGKSVAVDTIMDAATTPGGLTYQGIKGLRSYMGEMTPEQLAASGLRAGEVKQLYGALTTDLRKSVINAGGPTALVRFEKANRVFEQIAERRASLAKIVGMKGDAAPEAVFSQLVALAGTKTTANMTRLAAARRTIGAEAWNEVASAVVAKMGRDPRGEFSVTRFLTTYGDKLSPEGRRALFGTTGRDNLARSLEDIAFVSREIETKLNEFRNPSGTGKSTAATGLVMDMLHHPIRALSTVLGGNRIAATLAEPVSARLAADWLKAYRDSLTAPSASASAAVRAAATKLADEIVSRSGMTGGQSAAQIAARLSAAPGTVIEPPSPILQ